MDVIFLSGLLLNRYFYKEVDIENESASSQFNQSVVL